MEGLGEQSGPVYTESLLALHNAEMELINAQLQDTSVKLHASERENSSLRKELYDLKEALEVSSQTALLTQQRLLSEMQETQKALRVATPDGNDPTKDQFYLGNELLREELNRALMNEDAVACRADKDIQILREELEHYRRNTEGEIDTWFISHSSEAHIESQDKQITVQRKRIEELQTEIQVSNDDLASRICDIRIVDAWVQSEKKRIAEAEKRLASDSQEVQKRSLELENLAADVKRRAAELEQQSEAMVRDTDRNEAERVAVVANLQKDVEAERSVAAGRLIELAQAQDEVRALSRKIAARDEEMQYRNVEMRRKDVQHAQLLDNLKHLESKIRERDAEIDRLKAVGTRDRSTFLEMQGVQYIAKPKSLGVGFSDPYFSEPPLEHDSKFVDLNSRISDSPHLKSQTPPRGPSRSQSPRAAQTISVSVQRGPYSVEHVANRPHVANMLGIQAPGRLDTQAGTPAAPQRPGFERQTASSSQRSRSSSESRRVPPRVASRSSSRSTGRESPVRQNTSRGPSTSSRSGSLSVREGTRRPSPPEKSVQAVLSKLMAPRKSQQSRSSPQALSSSKPSGHRGRAWMSRNTRDEFTPPPRRMQAQDLGIPIGIVSQKQSRFQGQQSVPRSSSTEGYRRTSGRPEVISYQASDPFRIDAVVEALSNSKRAAYAQSSGWHAREDVAGRTRTREVGRPQRSQQHSPSRSISNPIAQNADSPVSSPSPRLSPSVPGRHLSESPGRSLPGRSLKAAATVLPAGVVLWKPTK